MVALRKWVTLAATVVMVNVLLPGAAWASGSPGAVALVEQAARRRSVFGGIGLLGMFCCLGVVALVILGVLLLARGRGSRRGPH